MINYHEPIDTHSQPLLASLRALIPDHDLSLRDLLGVISDQAAALRTYSGITTPALPSTAITNQSAIRIEDTDLPVAGFCFWDPSAVQWVIRLNRRDSSSSRRFTLAHEFAHIVWHGSGRRLFSGLDVPDRQRLAEHAADLFAGEALMPRDLVTAAHRSGLRTAGRLARHFRVSSAAMHWRLDLLDLAVDGPRTTPANPSSRSRLVPLVPDAPKAQSLMQLSEGGRHDYRKLG